jgi:hypothetical protein
MSECRTLEAFESNNLMAPPRPPKLSGAELAAQLTGTGFPSSTPITVPTPLPAGVPSPERPHQIDPKPPQAAEKTKGGRPVKIGGEGIPVNLRLAQADHMALARVATELLVPGRPMPTVQDVVRGLIRGALKDTETLKRLVREGRD